MVAECKALRAQISGFESEWTREHKRLPKMPERGAMQASYTHYKEMKKQIRDGAARDVQRLTRGHFVRVRLQGLLRLRATGSKVRIRPLSWSDLLGFGLRSMYNIWFHMMCLLC